MKKNLGLGALIALVLSSMVGAGIFSLPQNIAANAQVGAIAIGWLITGVGMAGGIGGFYLASSLGYSRQLTGSYQAGFLIFAALAVFALIGLTAVKTRWRTTWGAAHLTSAKI